MSKMNNNQVKKWLIIIVIISFILISILIYTFLRHQVPLLTWGQVTLGFILGFPASLISKVYGNNKMGQVKLDKKGLAISFKEQVYNWFIYYLLFSIMLVVYTYIVTGRFPFL